MESAHRDLPLHCTSRWLSCGKLLVKFVECLDEIKIFLSNQGKHYQELGDEKWLVDLLFLTDITTHLNELNLRLQGAGQTVLDLFETWKSFVAKLDVYNQDVQSSTFRYFKNLQTFSCDHEVNSSVIGGYMSELKTQFCKRFQDFRRFGEVFSFLIKPDSNDDLDLSLFDWMNVDDFRMQLIDLRSSVLWTNKFAELRQAVETVDRKNRSKLILQCWASLPDVFGDLKEVAKALFSVFGFTYMCEQIFSHVKFVLSPHRSRLTADNFEGCVQLKVTNYEPNIKALSEEKQEQGSHSTRMLL